MGFVRFFCVWVPTISLRWRHNGCDSVSNHQPHHCLLNRLFRRRSKKTSKFRVTGLCAGNSPVNSPHKWPITRKMFPFDDVIMFSRSFKTTSLTLEESHILITQGDVKQPWGVWLNGSYGFTANSQYNHKRTKLTKAVYIFYGAFYAAKSVITIQCIMETSRMIPIMGLRVWNGYLENVFMMLQ